MSRVVSVPDTRLDGLNLTGQFSIDILILKHIDVFVAIGNPERHVRKALHCGSKQQ